MSKSSGLSTSHANGCSAHHFLEPPTNSQRIIHDVTYVVEREFSPCVQYCPQLSASCLLVHEGTSVNGTSTIPHVICPTPPLSSRGQITSRAWPSASMPQPLPGSLGSGTQCAPFFSHPNSSHPPHGCTRPATQVERLERNWSANGESCTIAGCTEGSGMQGVQIGVDGRQQEVDDLPPSHNGRVEGDMHVLTPCILYDASLLLSIVPNILDESILYNGNWSLWDMIGFNSILIDESEIVCRWAGPRSTCNERVQVKNIKIHLAHKHGVQSNLQLYRCSWNECSMSKPMTRSSIARHVRERHSLVKPACPTCDETFTREYTLLEHFKSCPGRSALQACPQH